MYTILLITKLILCCTLSGILYCLPCFYLLTLCAMHLVVCSIPSVERGPCTKGTAKLDEYQRLDGTDTPITPNS